MKVTLSKEQNIIFNTALNLFKEKSVRIQRFIDQNEYAVLENKQLILTTVIDLSLRVQITLTRFRNSSNINSSEANSNTYKIFLLLVKYKELLSSVGKNCFQPFLEFISIECHQSYIYHMFFKYFKHFIHVNALKNLVLNFNKILLI